MLLQDIDAIIARGEQETKNLSDKLNVFKDHAKKFSMEGDKSLYDFDEAARGALCNHPIKPLSSPSSLPSVSLLLRV